LHDDPHEERREDRRDDCPEDRPGPAVGREEHEHVGDDRHRRRVGEQAGDRRAGGAVVGAAEEPQRGGEDGQGDPSEGPGVDVGEELLVVEEHDVGAVEDPDHDGEHEHRHRGRQQHHDLGPVLSVDERGHGQDPQRPWCGGGA